MTNSEYANGSPRRNGKNTAVKRAMEVSEYLTTNIGMRNDVGLFEVDVYPTHYIINITLTNDTEIRVPHTYNEPLRGVLHNTIRLITIAKG